MPKRGERKYVFTKDELYDLYVLQKLSTYKIGERFGCSSVPVTSALREFGIKVRRGGNSKGCILPLRVKIDAEELRRLYVDEKWPGYKLADRYGCSEPTIFVRLRELGVRIRHHNETKRGRPSPHRAVLDELEVERLYHSGPCVSISEVARSFGVSSGVIRRILTERGVRIRPLSETIGDKRNGKNNPNWNAELTPEERDKRRDSAKSLKWRLAIYHRDGFACQCCGDARGGNLNAHHINDHKSHKDKRFDISNGITLCEPCHRGFHKAFGYGNNDAEQLAKYLAEARRNEAA
jgi:5-methylcytosine-specific restriction endonuclease McrA